MLHLIQSVEGHVTNEGIELCAEILDITAAEVSGVATFYTMYKRRPMGEHHVGVCTNTLCAVMGGDAIFERLKGHLDVGNDETTEDGKVTLEHIECNAACDFAPVMTVNWEFFDNQTPESAVELVDKLRAGEKVQATRGATITSWRKAERVLAGYEDGLVNEGPAAAGRHSSVSTSPTNAVGPLRASTAPRRRLITLRQAPEPGRRQAERGRAGRHRACRVRDHRRGGQEVTDMLTPVLTADWGNDRAWTRKAYEQTGGYDALRKALTMKPDDLITLVKDSGLRGRGGAGFPTGMKWSFIPQDNPKPKYLVVNADESEPGTCKDIPLMMASPHVLIEGVIIAAHAIRAEKAFIYVRGEVLHVVRRLRAAAREAYEAGYLGRTSWALASTSTSSFTPVQAPTSAARRQRCSTRSRDAAVNRDCVHRSPPSRASTPARP